MIIIHKKRVPVLYLSQCKYSVYLLCNSEAICDQDTVMLSVQMAYELHGLLAGNVSIVTEENIKPSYGGDDEAFLRKVITPISRVMEKVLLL